MSPINKSTFTNKYNSKASIFISIFDCNTILSAYWHPIKSYAGIIGDTGNGYKEFMKTIKSDAGYWALAFYNRKSLKVPHTYFETYKEKNEIINSFENKNEKNDIKEIIINGKNSINENGNNHLMNAINSSGRLSEIKYFVENGENVNFRNDNNDTPLLYALYNKRQDVIKYLTDKGADLNIKNEKGETPLMIAYDNNMEEIVKYILEKGYKIKEDELKYIISKNKKEEQSKNIENILYNNENSIITQAFNENGINKLNEIFKFGGDIDFKNKYGNSLLIKACMLENKDIIDCLIKHKASINFKGEYDISPLIIANYFNNEKVVSQLIEAGAETKTMDDNGISPLNI